MRTTRRARWGSIAVAAVLLCGMTGGWSSPACAQTCGTTFTTSTSFGYTFTGGGSCAQVAANGCECVQFACPLGATPQVNHTETSVTVSTSLGPGTIFTGPCGSQTF